MFDPSCKRLGPPNTTALVLPVLQFALLQVLNVYFFGSFACFFHETQTSIHFIMKREAPPQFLAPALSTITNGLTVSQCQV